MPIPTTVIGEMLGVPPQDQARFQHWSKAIVSTIPSRWQILRTMPPVWLFLRLIRRLIQDRRAQPRDDLLGALVLAEEAGQKLSEEELLAMVFLLLVPDTRQR